MKVVFAQIYNEALRGYLWGPQSCLELLQPFSFIFYTCFYKTSQDASRGNKELEKSWFNIKIFLKTQISNPQQYTRTAAQERDLVEMAICQLVSLGGNSQFGN